MKPRQGRISRHLPTLLAILWTAVFPFWRLGETHALSSLVSGEVSLWDALLSLFPQNYSNITRAKWEGMLLLTFLTLCAGVWLLPSTFRAAKCRKKPHLPTLFWLGYLIWLTLSAFWGTYAGQRSGEGLLAVLWGSLRYEGLVTLFCYGLIFQCMSRHPVQIHWVLSACSAAMIVYALIVGLQYAGLNPLSLFPNGRSIRTNYEFQGTIGNIDMVSGWVCLLTPGLLGSFLLRDRHGVFHLIGGLFGAALTLCMAVQSGLIVLALTLLALLALSLRRPTCRARFMLLLSLVLLLFSLRKAVLLPWLDGSEEITLHASRTGLLAAALALALLPLAAFLRRHPLAAFSRKAVCLLFLLLGICCLLALYFLPLPQGSGLWEAQELLHGRAQDDFGSERLGVWRMTLDMTADSPWFGTGPDTFYYAFRAYLTQTGQTIQQNFDNPHNFFLQTMVNSGIPAMLLLLGLCISSLLNALKRPDGLFPALMASGFLVQGMFTFSICLTSPMFYCVLGLCAIPHQPDSFPDQKEASS